MVTAVTTVTAGQDPSIPAAFEQRAAVTKAAGDMVTAATKTKPTFTSVIPMRPEARVSAESAEDQCGIRDQRAIEHEPTACREERAAIIEYGAGVPRSWAEGFARLDPARPPADVPLRRWQQFIDDVGRFLDLGFAEKATAFGWEAFDIFGCDRDRPFARIDQQGLCWLIAGNRLVELFENAAIIQTWTGARQTWRCKPSEAGRVLAWELADGVGDQRSDSKAADEQHSGTGAPGAAEGAPAVSLFITRAQKAKLRERGFADGQIREMKPEEAHRILGLIS